MLQTTNIDSHVDAIGVSLGYRYVPTEADLFPSAMGQTTELGEFWRPDELGHGWVKIFKVEDVSEDIIRTCREAGIRAQCPFVALFRETDNPVVCLSNTAIPRFVDFIPFAQNMEAPRRIQECQPFISINDLRRLTKKLSDFIYAAHGHDRLRLFDNVILLLALKISDELTNPNDLKFPLLLKSPQNIDKEFASALHKALDYLGVSGKGIHFDLHGEPLLDCVRALAPYSFTLTSELGAPAEILGAFYQDIVSSTFRGTLGAYFTPKPLADLACAICEPRPEDTIFDISCGSGTLLVAALQQANSDKATPIKTVFGNDIQERMVLTTRINCFLYGVHSPAIERGDGLKIDLIEWHKKDNRVPKGGFSLIVANPPFAGFEKIENGVSHNNFTSGRKRSKRVHKVIPFIEKIVCLLKPGGRTAIVVPASVLNAEAEEFVTLRKYLADTCHAMAFLNVPRDAFVHTDCGIEGAIIVLRKKDAIPVQRHSKCFFYNVSKYGYDRRGVTEAESQIDEIIAKYRLKQYSDDCWIDEGIIRRLDRWDVPWLGKHLSGVPERVGKSWLALTDLCTIRNRRLSAKDILPNQAYRYFEVGDADMDTGEINKIQEAKGRDVLKKNRLRLCVRAGDVLLPNHRDSLTAKTASGYGRSAVIVTDELDGCITSDRFIALTPKIDSEVFVQLLNSRSVRDQLILHARGSASFDIRDKVLREVKVLSSVTRKGKLSITLKRSLRQAKKLRKRLKEVDNQITTIREQLFPS